MMTRGKRALYSSNDGEDIQPDSKKQKRPALASVNIVEALKVDSLQKFCASLEALLRTVVSEEVERALLRVSGPSIDGRRLSPEQIQRPDGRNLALRFPSTLPHEFFTEMTVEGEGGAAICVELIDLSTGAVVQSGPESCVILDVVVLMDDCNKHEEDDDCTEEDFERFVVKEREGKRPLLIGDLKVSLKEGVGLLGMLKFTDNSSWIPSKKFRLGVKVASGFCKGIRVRWAKTNAFKVKDQRGESYKKHYPPSGNDEVWRLEKIRKDGSYQKRLNKDGINTVQDFLSLLDRDSQKLRKILGGRLSDKEWHIIVDHAKTCNLNSGQNYSSETYKAETLAESKKVFVDTLGKKAYDGRMLLNINQDEESSSFQSGQQVSQHPPSLVSSGQASMNSGLVRDEPFSSFEQVSQPPFLVPSELAVADDPLFFEQLSILFPSMQTPSNSWSNVGGGMGPDVNSWLEDLLVEAPSKPPSKCVLLRLMLLSVLRFRRQAARKQSQLVELED